MIPLVVPERLVAAVLAIGAPLFADACRACAALRRGPFLTHGSTRWCVTCVAGLVIDEGFSQCGGTCKKGLWNGYLLSLAAGEQVVCRFCGEHDGDGHLWFCGNQRCFKVVTSNP